MLVYRFSIVLLVLLLVPLTAVSQETVSELPAKNQKEDLLYTIKGRVTDASTGQGFTGARLSVINTTLTVMTDENGSFEIKVPTLDVLFSIDAPGYQDQLVAARGRNELNIKIMKQTTGVSFYNESSLSAIDMSVLKDFSPEISSIDEDITNRLKGQINAMTHSGNPASGVSVFLQGLNSLNMSSQPLYIVDGIIWQVQDDFISIFNGNSNNPLAVIDPNDVEKISVLKNGASIYGSKGANGVIFIDTKRGRTMATNITANISFGYRSPFKSIPVMNAEEYRTYASDIIGGMYDHATAVEKYRFLDDDPTRSFYKANHNNTDWLDEINKGAMIQSYGISATGGDDIALYAFSLGYHQSEGNIDETDFNRMNARFNTDINLSKQFKLLFDISFTQTNRNVFNDGVDSISSPYYLSLIKSPLYNPYQFNNNGNLSNYLSDVDELHVGNPLSILKNGIGEARQYAFNTSIRPSYSFNNDKVMVGLLFSYGWNKLSENSFLPDFGIPETPLYNQQNEIYGISKNMVQDRVDKHSAIILDGRVDWNILKNSNHNLNAYGGYRFFSNSYKGSYAYGHNTGSDKMTHLSNTSDVLRSSTGMDDNWKSMSWYANADYSFKNRYLLNVSAAMDASSRFGKEADGALKLGGLAWGVFPSVSAGWLISSESFMKNVDFINFLKLNIGYGISGNDRLPDYATRSYFTSVKFKEKRMGLVLDNIGNETLKWETKSTANIGLDMSLLNNRWFLSANFYTSTTKDLLTQKQLKEVAGLEYYWTNDGKLENKGLEVSTNVRVLDLRDWKLDMGASIGHYKNKIKSLGNGSFITDVFGAQILTAEGQAAGVFYGYKTNGVFATPEAAQNAGLSIRDESGALMPFEAGDMNFQEVVKDGVIDDKDKQVIGDPNPDFYGNFNLNLSWKNFSLGALFTYSYGNDVYNALRANLEAGNNIYNQSTAMQNRWVVNGQETDIPRAVYGDPMGNSRFSDRWIEDGSYLKLKSITLSYKLPLKFTFLQGITIWGAVNNVYTFTDYLGTDPEFSYGNQILYQGVDAGLVPQSRSFNVGVKLNL